jgi:hypothetical protein
LFVLAPRASPPPPPPPPPAAAVLLITIRALMGPTFSGFLIANVFWVPWRAVGARLARWSGLQVPSGGQRSIRTDHLGGVRSTTDFEPAGESIVSTETR